LSSNMAPETPAFDSVATVLVWVSRVPNRSDGPACAAFVLAEAAEAAGAARALSAMAPVAATARATLAVAASRVRLRAGRGGRMARGVPACVVLVDFPRKIIAIPALIFFSVT
jgi:hypothetical protein